MTITTDTRQLASLLVQVTWQVWRTLAVALGRESLTPQQYLMLALIDVEPGLNQVTVASTLALSRVTVSQALKGLEARGLVDQPTNPADNRERQIQLTPAGIAALADATATLTATVDQGLSALVPADVAGILNSLVLLDMAFPAPARAETDEAQEGEA